MTDMHPLAQRPTYSQSQLSQYFTHLHRNISVTPPLTIDALLSQLQASPIDTITNLMRLHLSTTPWGNLALHYTSHHTLPLAPSNHLFRKLVTRNFGGYCMEQNLLFSNMLRSLGLSVYLTGARISHQVGDPRGKDPQGWGGLGEHMIIFVGFGEKKYLVDVGFGTGNALEPVLLREGQEVECQPGMRGRVVRQALKGSTRSAGDKAEWWIFQNKVVGQKDAEEQGWTNGYCFNETEWFEEDFWTVNHKVSESPRSWFTYTFVVTRMLLAGEEAARAVKQEDKQEMAVRSNTKDEGKEASNGDKGVEVVGSVTIFNSTVSRRIGGGQSEVLKECKNENERVQVLREWFGLDLAEEEREGIRGWLLS